MDGMGGGREGGDGGREGGKGGEGRMDGMGRAREGREGGGRREQKQSQTTKSKSTRNVLFDLYILHATL